MVGGIDRSHVGSFLNYVNLRMGGMAESVVFQAFRRIARTTSRVRSRFYESAQQR